MANHKSAEKRIRQNSKRRLSNRYYQKTSRNLIRDLRATDKKAEAEKALQMSSMPQEQNKIRTLVSQIG